MNKLGLKIKEEFALWSVEWLKICVAMNIDSKVKLVNLNFSFALHTISNHYP